MKLQPLLAQPIGMILLAIALVMEKFLSPNGLIDFMEGLLIGLSVILNIYYIGVVFQKNKK
jgi:hypothetical protein